MGVWETGTTGWCPAGHLLSHFEICMQQWMLVTQVSKTGREEKNGVDGSIGHHASLHHLFLAFLHPPSLPLHPFLSCL